MSLPPNIHSVFDIDEEVEDLITEITEINIDISDNDIDLILDATDGVRHTWKLIEDDKIKYII